MIFEKFPKGLWPPRPFFGKLCCVFSSSEIHDKPVAPAPNLQWNFSDRKISRILEKSGFPKMRHSPPPTFTTSEIQHPWHSPPTTFTTPNIHHPRHSLAPTFTTPDIHHPEIHHLRHSPPLTFTNLNIHYPWRALRLIFTTPSQKMRH